ncbi:MAG: phage major capsid protein [Bifidobacterium aquikefiri]|uniref:phage major capsid protein n=1 Tax=Bifidobacterium aquikefiri TaxID=1653207 RepID=UPI0039ECBE8A
MNLKAQLKAALDEVKKIAKKAQDEKRDFNDDEIKQIGELRTKADALTAKIKAADEAQASIKSMLAQAKPLEEDKPDGTQNIAHVVEGKTLGERFVKSAAYQGFRKTYPSGVGKDTPISIKAEHIGHSLKADPAPLNTADNANLLPQRLPGIDDLTYRWPTNILDLITNGVASSPLLQYRQLVSITSNAGITAESKTTSGTDKSGGLKPLSTLATQTKNASAYTYADGIEVTNQELSDDGALTALIDGILRQNLMLEMERVVLSGAGTDDEPAGILNTTGVLQQAFATDAITTIRKAKTLLRTASLTEAQAIVLNPEDDEAFDLAQDTQKRYYGNGPFGTGPQTIWGVPRVVSTRIPVGTAIMGDFSQVQMLNLEPTSVLVFNQHKDYAQRNLSYVRAECRCLQLIRQPAKLAILSLKSA